MPSQTVEDLMNESIDLHCHFGLTPSEARLAFHLVTGETLRSAAAELHISYETARTQLKNIFSKTGTCRQAELVAVIVLAFPALLKTAPQATDAVSSLRRAGLVGNPRQRDRAADELSGAASTMPDEPESPDASEKDALGAELNRVSRPRVQNRERTA